MKLKLNKQSWLKHGLTELSQNGSEALKADRLAKSLKVSRGSFYWHFADLVDFHEHLLAYWQEMVTQQVINDVDLLHDSQSKVRELVRHAFAGDVRLERAMRSWSAQNKMASDATEIVDNKRIDYLTNLLVAEDIAPTTARARAAFLYWAYLGQAMTRASSSEYLPDTALDEIIDLFLMPSAEIAGTKTI
ncbi:TetR/AcrR family transcriptional regulator [uncultured Shimia sp.]|uniref:TetR/AcrR family transcriptional regulator n=1 Tax=uncultured Shimia sp. TaxID=573152 RepID=UPI0025F95279|nr:TetR/AcrR family transcriptional regulator [uncultured Shimia sp.]